MKTTKVIKLAILSENNLIDIGYAPEGHTIITEFGATYFKDYECTQLTWIYASEHALVVRQATKKEVDVFNERQRLAVEFQEKSNQLLSAQIDSMMRQHGDRQEIQGN